MVIAVGGGLRSVLGVFGNVLTAGDAANGASGTGDATVLVGGAAIDGAAVGANREAMGACGSEHRKERSSA